MEIEIITKVYLIKFKNELLLEIQKIIGTQTKEQSAWLKSSEVCKLLSIFQCAFQNLRISGTIQYSKIEVTHYYKT
jgi:hypothetical protein